MKRKTLKGLCFVVMLVGVVATAQLASANSFVHASVCNWDQDAYPDMYYGWNYIYNSSSASISGYVICSPTRTYSWINDAEAYVYKPANTYFSGYANFISKDGGCTDWQSGSLSYSSSGNKKIDFTPTPNDCNTDGYMNYELYIPASGYVYGFYTN